MTHLTLRLTRTQGNWDTMEERLIRVDLPLDATEEDLRRAFAHVEVLVDLDGQRFMDAAAELVTTIVESREAIENERPPSVESQIADAMPDHPLAVARSMDEQRAERAEEQHEQDVPAPEAVAGQ